MEYRMYTCHHCAYETPSLTLMLRHQAEKHQKPEVTNNYSDKTDT